MGNLVDSIVRLFEFIIQGVLTLFVVGYFLIWFHPLKDAVADNVQIINRYILHPHWEKPVPDTAIAVIFIGGLYFLGVITNVIGYRLLEPVHHRLILAVAQTAARQPKDSRGAEKSSAEADIPFWSTALLPLRIYLGDQERIQGDITYTLYLHDEALWRNCNLVAMKDALDPLIKQSRIIRGTVVCALAFCIIATLKFLYFSAVWCIFFSKRLARVAGWLYKNTVNPFHADREKLTTPPRGEAISAEKLIRCRWQNEREDTKRSALSAIVYASFSAAIYLFSIAGWQTLEKEYHLMALEGAKTACPSVVAPRTPGQ